MSRAQAAALALVNWRGVFYERYLLDQNVTALEGANGAGKTTVLIACYVVLLPDMSRLRFTNLGEHGATGGDKGLWGRLGESSRPSYAVLELRLAHGERVLAGVHLERKIEPAVELTPFVITGLGESTRLQDLLLERGEMDSVPELPQLREQVAREGAHIETFSTVKDYFGKLFDLGVTPLRLASDADRTKFNEMLRTSMTGGISRALTSELRDFLLKEETGLADTLKRMRANLDACRRTRIEVDESKRLEQEIAGIYEAGQQMFAAALHAARERAEELRRRYDEASRLAKDAEDKTQALNTQCAAATLEQDHVTRELNEIEGVITTARDYLDRLRRGHAIQLRILRQETLLTVSLGKQATAQRARDDAEASRQTKRREHEAARNAVNLAAEGLADFQKGLEELHRRASEHQIVMRRMAEAQGCLPDESMTPDNVEQCLDTARNRHAHLSQESVRLENSLTTIEERRRQFLQVLKGLQILSGDEPILPNEAFLRARQELTALRDMDSKAVRRDALAAALDEAERSSIKQKAAKELAHQLGAAGASLDSATSVQTSLDTLEADVDSADLVAKEERRLAGIAAVNISQLQAAKKNLERQLASWREIISKLEPLERTFGIDLRSRESLHALRTKLDQDRHKSRLRHASFQDQLQQVNAERQQLEQSGGTFPQSLLDARDAVDGELLAGRFEELSIDEAGEIEALLGPLSEAIVVEDSRRAAESLSHLSDKPATVWLVGGDAVLPLDASGRPHGDVMGDSVLVGGSVGWRLTSIPRRPTLGRLARERRITELNDKSKELTRDLEDALAQLRSFADALNATDQLLAEAEALERGDPSGDLNSVIGDISSELEQQRKHEAAATTARLQHESLLQRRKQMRTLLQMAWLLDEPDLATRAAQLRDELDEAREASRHLVKVADARSTVEYGIDLLRVVPESEQEIAQMRERCTAIQQASNIMLQGVLALQYVVSHRVALSWTDAEAVLQSKTALEPSLRAQLDSATAAAAHAQGAVDAADSSVTFATASLQSVQGEVKSLESAIARDREERQACDVEFCDEEIIELAEDRLGSHKRSEQQLRAKDREITERLGSLRANLEQATEDAEKRRREREDAEKNWQPAEERWNQLESLAGERRVLAAVMSRRFLEALTGRGSANLRTDARTHAATLKERLAHARDSKQVLEVVNNMIGSQELSGEACLEAWVEVRHWLQRRIPAQIADVAEPLEALVRLRSHLDGLQERLARQESDLRGDSGDVARNIDIHIRRAQRQVNRLNSDLDNIKFGSIHGVQIRLERVERMQQVLHALREGEAQAMLFQPDMPIEAAFEELFRRYGGRTTGQRLLDYREYVEPKVEVRRQASQNWESANPLRMSTGEAIGIGAALMMVVLTAWERDANLLRPKRAQGTLRMLFLDEANRLSQDNLSVLFDLCQNLDLQLIIAAPEVARAEGNTTYRLVRRVNEHGSEEVIVTGRRLAERSQVNVGQN